MITVQVDVPTVVPRSILSNSQKHAVITSLNNSWHAEATIIKRSADNMNDIVFVSADAEASAIEESIRSALKRKAS